MRQLNKISILTILVAVSLVLSLTVGFAQKEDFGFTTHSYFDITIIDGGKEINFDSSVSHFHSAEDTWGELTEGENYQELMYFIDTYGFGEIFPMDNLEQMGQIISSYDEENLTPEDMLNLTIKHFESYGWFLVARSAHDNESITYVFKKVNE